jgi:hypothetical protein
MANRLNIGISDDLKQRLEAEAKRRGIRATELVRWAIVDALVCDPQKPVAPVGPKEVVDVG